VKGSTTVSLDHVQYHGDCRLCGWASPHKPKMRRWKICVFGTHHKTGKWNNSKAQKMFCALTMIYVYK
jgi:hypothetical protein